MFEPIVKTHKKEMTSHINVSFQDVVSKKFVLDQKRSKKICAPYKNLLYTKKRIGVLDFELII